MRLRSVSLWFIPCKFAFVHLPYSCLSNLACLSITLVIQDYLSETFLLLINQRLAFALSEMYVMPVANLAGTLGYTINSKCIGLQHNCNGIIFSKS